MTKGRRVMVVIDFDNDAKETVVKEGTKKELTRKMMMEK